MDREEDAGRDAGEGGILPASHEGGDGFVEDSGEPEAGIGLGTLTTALVRLMDLVPADLVLCSPAGSILHANQPARKRLEAGEGQRGIREEIRFLCVGLHLQIAEQAGRDETEVVPQAERRVALDGSEVHLRAVDLGVPRHGRSPAILVLLDARDPFSDQDLERQGLTRAEIRIVRLVMRGRTNRAIAHALSVSVHTVRHHVQHILDKVGVGSRTQLMETLHLRKNPIADPKPPPEDAADRRHPHE